MMRGWIAWAALALVAGGTDSESRAPAPPSPPGAPPEAPRRSVTIRDERFELVADGIDVRWEGGAAGRVVLSGAPGRPVELIVRPMAGGDGTAPRGAAGVLDGLRASADRLAIELREPPEGDVGGRTIEVSGPLRLAGPRFSLDCDRVVVCPARRTVAISGVRDARLDSGRRRRLPPISLSTDRLDLDLGDTGLEAPWEVTLANPAGFRADVDGARAKIRELVLRLEP